MNLVLFIVLLFGTPFVLWNWWYNFAKNKKLKKHQKEWEARKSLLNSFDEIFEAYNEYTDMLWVTERNSVLVCCFPRM